MKRRPFIKSVLGALGALFAPAFALKEADATLYMMPFVPCATDDWAARSAGALLADRLDTAGSISSYAFAGGSDPRLWVLDPTIKSGCSLGSAKFVVANTDVAASGEALIPFGTNFGSGSTFWISYRIRQLATFAFQPWPTPSETGAKVSVLSHTSGSNQPWEAVVQANYNEGLIGGYHQDGVVTAIPWDVSAITAYGSDFIWQPAVDRGVNPLLGTNPDTAAAWSAGEQDRARYGGLYTSKSLASSKLGLGDWLSGGERHWPGEWVTITQRIVIGTFGSFDSRWTIWSARDGQPYTLLADNQNIRFGGSGPFNAVWLLPYVSQRVAGGKQISSRTNNIGGVSLYTCGLSTPIGTGVLEYDASVQRFRWHGVSEAFGAQAGFSAANGKMWRNVISGGDPNSYVVLHVDTPSSLPPSGVVTDNVVIADGRPDTQVNYADFILSNSAISATGGYRPLGASALSDLARSMTAGTWAPLTTNGLASVMYGGEACINMMGFLHKGAWDPVHGLAHIVDGDHGNTGLRHIAYDEASNTWNMLYANTGIPGHGYDHLVCNPATGDLYMEEYGGGGLARRLYGGSWSVPFISNPVGSEITYGVCFWTGSLTGITGGRGAILVHECAFGQIWGFDVGTGTWSIVQSGSDIQFLAPGGYHNLCAYSQVYNCAVFGGGNSYEKVMFRYNSNGTWTRLTDAPSGINIGIQRGSCSVDPVTGKFLIMTGSQLWELNPTGSGTYTQQTGTRVPPAAVNTFDATCNACCVIPISTYGVTMVVSADGGSGENVYLYKHA